MKDRIDKGGKGGLAQSATPTALDSHVAALSPASVIFYMLDEATRRTTPQGGVEFGQLKNGTIFHHVDLWRRIDEYVERLIQDRLTDLQPSDPEADTKDTLRRNGSLPDLLDEYLTQLENAVQRDIALRMTQHRSGRSPKSSHAQAKAQILSAVRSVIEEAKPDSKDWFNRRELEWEKDGDNCFTSKDSAMYDQGYNKALSEYQSNLLRKLL